jgi:16S rRNA (uracil1498-N3)-methyltransferase
MRLSRIFVETELGLDTTIELPDQKSHYVKNVLRLKNGQKIILFNGSDDTDYTASVQITGKQVIAQLNSALKKSNDPAIHITILQACGRIEHMDYLVQKAVELGVSRIEFFNTERTQSPIKKNRAQKKLLHWQGISISACEQSGRNRIPPVLFTESLHHCLNSLLQSNRLLLDFNGQRISQLDKEFNSKQGFNLLIGPEGGLTPKEIELALENDFKPCVLGPRVLRMETAATSILTIVQHRFGDLN